MRPEHAYGFVEDWLLHDGLLVCKGCTHMTCGTRLEVDTPDEIQRDGKEAIQYGAKFRYGNRDGKITWWDIATHKQVAVDHFVPTGNYESETPEIAWTK